LTMFAYTSTASTTSELSFLGFSTLIRYFQWVWLRVIWSTNSFASEELFWESVRLKYLLNQSNLCATNANLKS
jgi:hypothetical protein